MEFHQQVMEFLYSHLLLLEFKLLFLFIHEIWDLITTL